MASVTLKKQESMRYAMKGDPREMAASYRLSVQPRKRSVNVIKRSRRKGKNKDDDDDVGRRSRLKSRQSSKGDHSEDACPPEVLDDVPEVAPATGCAMYLKTTSWGLMDDPFELESLAEPDDEDEEEEEDSRPASKVEPACVLKYKQVCQLLGCRPIKGFIRALTTDSIALRHMRLTKEELKACVVALMHTDTVESVWFDSNSLGVHGAVRITDIIPKKYELTELRITNNRLCSEGAKAICDALVNNAHVRRLDLSGNDFNDDDALVFKAFLAENLFLRALNLSHNNFRERGGQILGDGLATNRTLQKLDLGWNHLRMAGAVAIGKSLKDNCDLEDLSLAWNGFHLRGCHAIGEALKVNNSLTRLDITCNRVSELALAQILKGLAENTTLEKLIMPMNPLSPYAAFKVLKFIDEHDSLAITHVDLGSTCVYEDFEAFLKEVQERRDLEVIRGPCLRTGLKFQDPLAADDDGMGGDNPLVVLMEYCRLQNLRLVDMFRALDTDGSQSLSYDEFKSGLKRAGIDLSEESLTRMIDMLDLDGDGEIDFSELVAGQKEYKELLRAALSENGGKMDASVIGQVGLRVKDRFAKKGGFIAKKW